MLAITVLPIGHPLQQIPKMCANRACADFINWAINMLRTK